MLMMKLACLLSAKIGNVILPKDFEKGYRTNFKKP